MECHLVFSFAGICILQAFSSFLNCCSCIGIKWALRGAENKKHDEPKCVIRKESIVKMNLVMVFSWCHTYVCTMPILWYCSLSYCTQRYLLLPVLSLLKKAEGHAEKRIHATKQKTRINRYFSYLCVYRLVHSACVPFPGKIYECNDEMAKCKYTGIIFFRLHLPLLLFFLHTQPLTWGDKGDVKEMRWMVKGFRRGGISSYRLRFLSFQSLLQRNIFRTAATTTTLL